MGDLRNKVKRILDEERMAGQSAAERAQKEADKRAHPLPRCACGFTWHDVRPMWWIEGKDRWAPARLICPSCVPAEHVLQAACDVARIVDTEPVAPLTADPATSAAEPAEPLEIVRSETVLLVDHPGPGRHIVRRRGPKNTVIVVCRTMYAAVEAAKREARRIAAHEGQSAVVELEHPDGNFRPVARFKPKGWHLTETKVV